MGWVLHNFSCYNWVMRFRLPSILMIGRRNRLWSWNLQVCQWRRVIMSLLMDLWRGSGNFWRVLACIGSNSWWSGQRWGRLLTVWCRQCNFCLLDRWVLMLGQGGVTWSRLLRSGSRIDWNRGINLICLPRVFFEGSLDRHIGIVRDMPLRFSSRDL